MQNLGTATNTLQVNGVDLLTRTGIAQTTALTYGMFGVAGYRFNVQKKYHKVWVDGILVYDYIPVLNYNGVPCLYNRVDGQFLYAETGQTPTVLGKEIHPIERIYVANNVSYNLGNFLEISDKIWCKVLPMVEDTQAIYRMFQAYVARTEITLLTNNQTMRQYWFNGAQATQSAPIYNGTIYELVQDISGTTINGVFYANSLGIDQAITLPFILFANNSFTGWFYGLRIVNGAETPKINIVPFVDETGVAGLFDTVSRTILTKQGSGTPTYDDIELESIENKVITGGDTGGPYISLPYEANNDTQIACRFKIKNTSTGRYMYGNTQYRMSHSASTFSITYGPGYYKSITTNPINVIRVKRNSTKNYLNDVEVESNDERNPFTTTSFSIFTQGSSNNGMVGIYNYFQIGENNQLLYNLVPTLRNGVVGMVNTIDGTMYPNLRSGVDFYPNFLPQRKMFNALDNKSYWEFEIDTTLKSASNAYFDFGRQGTYNVITDWGDGTLEANGVTHTYATAGKYTIRIYQNDTYMDCCRVGNQHSTCAMCVTKVNNEYPKTTIANFANMFRGCTNLETIPENFFENNTHLVSIGNLFREATEFKYIPPKLLRGMKNVTMIDFLFPSTSIEVIPKGLFDDINKAGIASLVAVFSSTKIKTVPAGLLDGFVNVTNITQIFNECHELETLPDLLFKDLTKVTNFRYCFYGNPKMIIPANLFCNEATDMATRFVNVTSVDFTGMFNRSSWTGTTPGTAPQLWNYTMPNSVTSQACYAGAGNNATSLSNYSSIPSAWGGPA